jgi:hypothetical protein
MVFSVVLAACGLAFHKNAKPQAPQLLYRFAGDPTAPKTPEKPPPLASRGVENRES